MGQNILVDGYEADGQHLVDAVRAAGFPVALAFWAKLSDKSATRLYLVSPFLDEHGAFAAYGFIHPILDRHPELSAIAHDVAIIGMNDGLAQSADELRKSKPFPRPIRVRGGTLGGRDLDEAYIYPPFAPAPTA